MRRFISRLLRPIEPETRALLDARWRSLEPGLRRWNQALGRQVVHCGFTMGAPYCALSCTHCYLPANANGVPIPSLDEMRAQVEANRDAVGPGGALQITGGDVVDAYLKEDRFDELVEVVRLATRAELVPMLMTHGEGLFEEPERLERLVLKAGLRQVSFHVDITQKRRRAYGGGRLKREADLDLLRDRVVDLVFATRRRTRRRLSAAMTVTVTEENLESIGDIARWMLRDPRNPDAVHVVSFQPAAEVGRTRIEGSRARSQATWEQLDAALRVAMGARLPDEGFVFGHPDCSRVVPLLAFYGTAGADHVLPVIGDDSMSQRYWQWILERFGGAKGTRPAISDSIARKLGVALRNPAAILRTLSYAWRRLSTTGDPLRLAGRLLRGQARSFALVMHSFMDATEMTAPRSPRVESRLAACAFRGAVPGSSGYDVTPMCAVNSGPRERAYSL